MARKFLLTFASGLLSISLVAIASEATLPASAQEQTPKPVEIAISGSEVTISEPLSAEEMEVLVARIALYPDELVAVIVAASLYPVQIVQAQRYLDQVKTKPDLKPDSDWDGSVISLLNYPEIVKMMSDDLDWTEALGEAVTNQEKDLLEAIQQLRDKAVAQGHPQERREDDSRSAGRQGRHSAGNGRTRSMSPSTSRRCSTSPTMRRRRSPTIRNPIHPIIIRRRRISRALSPALSGARRSTGTIGACGAAMAVGATIIDIDCNNCFNNRDFNGKMNWNDVDWNNVDRSKISFDRSQFN